MWSPGLSACSDTAWSDTAWSDTAWSDTAWRSNRGHEKKAPFHEEAQVHPTDQKKAPLHEEAQVQLAVAGVPTDASPAPHRQTNHHPPEEDHAQKPIPATCAINSGLEKAPWPPTDHAPSRKDGTESCEAPKRTKVQV